MNASRIPRWFGLLAGALLVLAPMCARPAFDPVNDDTDIFLANPSFPATRPNVLIFLDNTANWSQSTGAAAPLDTKYGGVRAALNAALAGLSDGFNVGLAMFVETGNPNNNVDGAYLRFGIRQMTAANKAMLISTISALDNNGDKGNNATYSLAMNELYNYFAGTHSYSGHGKAKADVAGNATNPASALGNSPLPAGAQLGSASSAIYTSPIVDGCQKNFIIFISNGEAADNSASLSTAQSFLSTITGQSPPPTISLTPNGSQGNWADEYSKFMATGDCNLSIAGVQNITTYTLDVIPKTSGQGPSHTALLKSMAANGKGKYFAINDMSGTAQLESALTAIFSEVQAVNSVFASTTLPVSVNVRGTNLNQVYIGVFRPDANKSPRWLGNLKLYKLGVNSATSSLFLADATGAPSENSATGFISSNATSFWTSTSTYWGFRDSALNGVGGSSDAPDGDLVEKGGAAQRLRVNYPTDQSTRKLYTCTGAAAGGLCAAGAALSASPFTTANVTPGDLGAYTTKSVSSISSSGTAATATVAAHGWSNGDVVRITGATPADFNGSFTIGSVTANTFEYTMSAAPDATRARVNAPNHLLLPGDVTCVSAWPSGYSSCNAPGYAPITRIDNNNFDYTMSSSVASNASSWTVWGGRLATRVYGTPSSTSGKVILPAHGLGTAGTSLPGSYVLGASPYNFESYYRTATVVDANTISYTSDYTLPSTPNLAQVTAPNHGWSSNQSVTLFGATLGGYNGVKTVTKLDNNTLTFASAVTTADTTANMRIGHTISTITRPNTGPAAGRDTATITTLTAHGLTVGATINIYGSGTFPASGYDGSWVVQATPTTTTFTVFNAAIDSAPASVSASNMIAGYPVTRIDPMVSASGTIYFFKTLTANSITPLTSAQGTISAGRPIDGDTTLRDNVVAWVRGADNNENENPATDAAAPYDVRPSIHGDVLHSRPAVINYNRYGNDNDIYTFYGANDGVFRGVKGGLGSNETGINPGDERWGFIPKEFFPSLTRLRSQTPPISSSNQKNYFADGSISIYQKDVNNDGKFVAADGDKVYLYVSMRRGGDFIYALDVSDPANPKLLWRKGKGDAGYDMLGQTWSEPKVSRISASLGNVANPDNVVLIFGAGYDKAVEDPNPCLLNQSTASGIEIKAIGTGTVTYTSDGSCTISGATGSATTVNRSVGRGVLVVDAFNGNVVWQAGSVPSVSGTGKKLTVSGMTHAIPSDLTVLDKNRDGFADRLYFGDTGGKVWRVDIASADFDQWTVTNIANLSTSTATDVSGKRKFLFPPDLVFGTDSSGNYTAVLLGSGDREHPFDTNVQNRFYMLKDRDAADPGNPQFGAPNATSTKIAGFGTAPTGSAFTEASLFNATNVAVVQNDALGLNGWYIGLGAGEKVISSATSIAGTTFFNTNQPSSTAGGGSCGSNLGIAREYLVGYADAAATVDLNSLGTLSVANRSTIHTGGGYLPSPVPVVVDIDGKRYQAVISGTSVRSPPGLTLDSRTRLYWYKEID